MGAIARLLSGIGPGTAETDEQRGLRVLFLAFALIGLTVALVWGLLYLAYGEDSAALVALAIDVIGIVSILAFHRHRRFGILRDTYGVMALAMSFLIQVSLGGFRSSGTMVAFGAIAPLSSLAFIGIRRGIVFLLLFAGELALAVALEPAVAHPNRLPPELVTGFFAANVAGVVAMAFGLLAVFIGQKDEAMRRLATEEERSEALLLNILPREIAPRLKAGEQPIADGYEQATILFADIVGFTSLSAGLPPGELVSLLDRIFRRFDELAERHGVEKIRTMGDAYMAVAGVPRRRMDHAPAIARLALDMRAFLEELRAGGEQRVDCRIGINSGPLVGGVIGLRKFIFDVWGDPVNTASRMESTGIPGRIQLAPATYELLKDAFECAPRGTVDVKGKGEMPTWFLVGARA